MQISAVLFDMDGLILDTERLSKVYWEKVGKEYGYDISLDFMISIIGSGIEEAKELFCEQFGADFPFHEIRNKKNSMIKDYLIKNGVPKKKGIVELLEYLQKNAIPRVVATTTYRKDAVALLKGAGIYEYFNEVVCGDEVTKVKPDPEIYIKASSKIGVDPINCLILEDSHRGIKAAYKAGANPVFIPDMLGENEEIKGLIKFKCDSLLDVIDILENDVQKVVYEESY
ncbi:HAD family hydrolase [Abyssisolibacter fermentans]|uniref:HAD family hydrolase n=1 Tax=Abyssisolibacter fermentans TaxID=1766203 RepID=UPI00082DC4A6|nr:HAD family phosphatase [Abyssisolibacter fermentans]